MTRHPAYDMDFDELFAGLCAEVDEGNVAVKAQGDLRLFTYTKKCIFEKNWNSITTLARGLVLDISEGFIVAAPFPKFFNVGELTEALPNEPFEAFEKMDGSLGILFFYDGAWEVITKGSFDSDQSRWAAKWFEGRNVYKNLIPGCTYLFEIIYPENRIVIKYDNEGLVLLGGYDEEGYEFDEDDLAGISHVLQCRQPQVYDFATILAMLERAKDLPGDQEGWVVRYKHSGLRVKVNGDDYKRLHACISRITPLGIWELMRVTDDMNTVKAEIPEEFWTDFDGIVYAIKRQVMNILVSVMNAWSDTSHMTDKEVGLMLDTLSPAARKFIFQARRHGINWADDPKSFEGIMKMVRPTGNRLDNYTPSYSMNRALEGDE